MMPRRAVAAADTGGTGSFRGPAGPVGGVGRALQRPTAGEDPVSVRSCEGLHKVALDPVRCHTRGCATSPDRPTPRRATPKSGALRPVRGVYGPEPAKCS